jgi:AraC-like DNA-binding protein
MKLKLPSLRRLSESGWLRALRADTTTCSVTLAGFNGRFRTHLKWSTGTLVLRQHIVYLFAEHSGRFQSGENEVACARGSCFWVTPGTTFQFSAASENRPLVYRFRFEVTQGAQSLVPPQPWYMLADASCLLETVKSLAQETTAERAWEEEMMRARLLQLSVEMFRQPAANAASVFNEAQRQALQHECEQHPAARLTAKDMAQIVGLSSDYFTRCFRQSYGLTPRAWVLRERMRHAALLLEESTLRIGEIADRLGYTDAYLFSRQFRAQFGQSPRQWRQREG